MRDNHALQIYIRDIHAVNYKMRDFVTFLVRIVHIQVKMILEVAMMESFKNRFEIALRERKMNQAYISEKTGIAHGTISNYARGKYAPRSDKRKQIAEVLKVNEAWLAGYDVPKYFTDLSVDDQLTDLEKDPADQMPFFGRMEHVTDEEFSLLNAYRKADSNIQNAIKLMLNI